VLLLHGIGANSLHWRYQLAGLADRFRLIAWNAPGYLLSDNLRAETPTCRDYADALDDLLSALGIEGFDIVANSFGTRVAQCFAYHWPGRIGRAVFTGTSIPRGMSPEERARSIEARARMIERGGYGFGDRAAALLGSAATADTLALVQQTLRATNPAGFMQAARSVTQAETPPLGAGAYNALADGSGRGRLRDARGDECRTARCRAAARSSGHARRLRPRPGSMT
jgi:pimeloyl-ACP methyl ester carboxylesterase